MTASGILAAGAVVFVIMLGELWLSRGHERRLRAAGAVEPAGDVYRTMAWAYPGCFAAMIAEGAWLAPAPAAVAWSGLAVFAAAKALKYWAIASLGGRWTFRVLVPPGSSRIRRGPYRWLSHPNYVAVALELLGVALAAHAVFTGPIAIAAFGALMLRRIRIEEKALAGQ